MNYRKLPMLALLAGICVLSLPARVSANNTWIQNFFSGPVVITAGTEFHVCATNAAVLSQGPNGGAVKVLIGLLSADDSGILFVREAALNPPGTPANQRPTSRRPCRSATRTASRTAT